MGFWQNMRRRLGLVGRRWGWSENPYEYSGEHVSPQSALQLSTYWANVKLLSQTVGTTSLPLYKKEANNGRTVLTDHELYTILHDSPNADQTSVEYWEGQTADLCIHGNGYSEKQFAGAKLIGLRPLSAEVTEPFRTKEGALKYRHWDRGKVVELPEDKVFHIKGFGNGGDVGLSPIRAAAHALGIAQAAERASGGVFSNGLRARGFFVMPGSLDADQRKQAEKTLVEPYSGPNGKQIGILEAGVKFEATNLKPVDAELLMQRRFSVEEICRFFGVPPIMIGHVAEGQTMWGTGVEELLMQFYTIGLRPFFVRIEKAITKSLILPGERGKIYAEFNIESLLRANAQARSQLFSTYVTHGIMTRNEVRAKENLPRIPGGADELTVQSQNIPVNDIGKEPAVQPQGNQPQQNQNPQKPRLQVIGA